MSKLFFNVKRVFILGESLNFLNWLISILNFTALIARLNNVSKSLQVNQVKWSQFPCNLSQFESYSFISQNILEGHNWLENYHTPNLHI